MNKRSRKRGWSAESPVGDDTRYVWVVAARCPVCRSDKHDTRRTERHDGTRVQRKVCRSCGHKFFLIFEDGFQNLESSAATLLRFEKGTSA